MRLSVVCIVVLAGLLAVLPSPLHATVGYIQGYVYGQWSGGSLHYGDYFYVKYCTSSNGSTGCSQTQANASGFYSLNVPAWGSYWVFAWSNVYNWGSTTQSAAAGTIYISNSSYNIVSRPRPSVPLPIYPQDQQGNIPYNQQFNITWTGETDPHRSWPGVWPIVWDLWASSWDYPIQPIATGLTTAYYTVGVGWLAPASWYNTKEVTRMNVNVGNPGDQYYSTSGQVYRWWTSGP